jgi:hypothetical protein
MNEKVKRGEIMANKNICESCGASWNVLAQSLDEPVTSENYQIAKIILGNCSECRKHFIEARIDEYAGNPEQYNLDGIACEIMDWCKIYEMKGEYLDLIGLIKRTDKDIGVKNDKAE